MTTLLDELKARRAALVKDAEAVDIEAANLRQEYDEKLKKVRQKRIPLEEKIRAIDSLIQLEGGK